MTDTQENFYAVGILESPCPAALVSLPRGFVVGVNRAHGSLVGGSGDVVMTQAEDIKRRLDESPNHGSYGACINAIVVLWDSQCMVSVLLAPSVTPTPKILYRYAAPEHGSRRYLASLVHGRRVRLDRPDLYAIQITNCDGVSIALTGAVEAGVSDQVDLQVTLEKDGQQILSGSVTLKNDLESAPYFLAHQVLQRILVARDRDMLQDLSVEINRLRDSATQYTQQGFWANLAHQLSTSSSIQKIKESVASIDAGLFDPLALRTIATPALERHYGDLELGDPNEARFVELNKIPHWRHQHVGQYVGIADAEVVVSSPDKSAVLDYLLTNHADVSTFYAFVAD